MKKVKGLTKRLAAVLLSGMVVVGAVPGTVLASESPEDMGQTSEMAIEDIGDTLSEEVSAEGYVENPSAGDVGSYLESQEIAEENIDQIDAAQDSEEPDETAEESQDVQDSVEVDETEESAAGQDAWDYGTGEESFADENPAFEADTDPETIDENEQAAASDQEAVYADEDAEKASWESSDATAAEEEAQPELTGASEEEESVSEDAAMAIVDSGTCGDDLTWTLDEEGTLTISGGGRVESSAFEHNDRIKKVIIGGFCTGIGAYAFSDCSNLTSITTPDSVTSISIWAFSQCTSLTSITIPKSVTSIGEAAFADCPSLANIFVEQGNQNYRSEDGVLFNSDQSILVFYPGGREGVYSIPDTVTSIGYYAFAGCSSLTGITIPDSVTSMGESVFRNCSNLTSITIPESITGIDSYAFYGCSSLTSITIPERVTGIGLHAFSDCSSLTSITIPESVISIDSLAFSDCRSLTSITIPKSVSSIGAYAFQFCSNLVIYCYYGSNAQLYAEGNNIPFKIFFSEASVTIPDQSYTYTGDPLEPEVTVTLDETQLTKDTDYEVTYSNNTDAGSDATVTVTGTGNYYGEKEITFTIEKAVQTITASDLSLTYPNSGQITVSGNKGSLTYKSSDTSVATVDSAGKVTAKSGGTAKVTITAAATAQYNAASKTITVNVAKAAQSITAKASATVVFVGQTTSVSVTGAKGARSFKSSDTAIASVTSEGKVTAKKTGTVEITATSAATAQYNAASKTVSIKVVPAVTSSLTAANQVTGIKLAWKKVDGATGYKIYRNSTLIKTITDGSTVTYTDTKANTNMSRYIYKVMARGPAGDSTLARTVTVYRVARPALSSVTNSAASVMTAKWTTIARVSGYQIKYSTSKTFASDIKTVNAYGRTTDTMRIGKLTRGKVYYVKVRAFKLVGNGVYWSEWSPARTVRISK